jgi:hypothetical protein
MPLDEKNSEFAVVPLTENQKNTTLDKIEKRKPFIFNTAQLQLLMKIFGPHAKLTDVLESLPKQEETKKQQ